MLKLGRQKRDNVAGKDAADKEAAGDRADLDARLTLDKTELGLDKPDLTKAEPTDNDSGTKTITEPYTYIHEGTLFEGNLSARGRVRVAGTLKGNISVEGVIEVTEGGRVEGELLQAETVIIIGRVRANVRATKMEIWKKGVLQGDVHASAIDIEEGATFVGRSDMRSGSEQVPETKNRVAQQGKTADNVKAAVKTAKHTAAAPTESVKPDKRLPDGKRSTSAAPTAPKTGAA